jgi:hypothetical protein
VVSEFFCLSCSRTVYSHPDETCPVCSSPLLEIRPARSEPESDQVVIVRDAVEAAELKDQDLPPESKVLDPLD